MLGARAGHHRDHGGRADLRVPPEQVLEAHRGLRGPGIPQVLKLSTRLHVQNRVGRKLLWVVDLYYIITSPIRNSVDTFTPGISPLTGVCRATWTQPSPGQTGKRISSSGRSTGDTPTRPRTKDTPSSSARGLTASPITSTRPSCGPAMGRSTSSRALTTG